MTATQEKEETEASTHKVASHSKIIIHLIEKKDEEELESLADQVTDLLDEDGFEYSKVDYVE